MGLLSTHYYVQDGVIPRTLLPEVLERIDELSKEYGMPVANVFHAGDGNLHPLVCYDGHTPGEAERAEELAGEIVLACVEAGGSITREHRGGPGKKGLKAKKVREARPRAVLQLRLSVRPAAPRTPA